ncbi:MAG TPA: hypothetical protein VI299_19975 [Polyangiales bacterium]
MTRSPARVRWGWLWSPRTDLLWNFLPFWLGFVLAAALFATRGSGTAADPGWSFGWGGTNVKVLAVVMALYGPLIDGPHLWGTIARTYTDAEEWAQRRWLFISSLLAFLIGPVLILTPYVINTVIPLSASTLDVGFQAWSLAFGTYATFHINKQHWGFVSLYKRKNGENDAREARIDSWFFNIAIWAPYIAMTQAPWDGTATPLQAALYTTCHAVFLTLVLAYGAYQIVQWQKGRTRNGPKLAYMATVLALYYVTFACDPRLAAFWVLITSTGHCLQYHAVVWQYGTKKYGEKGQRKLPNLIFDNLWLYAVLGLGYALFTFQGPGAGLFKRTTASLLNQGMFANLFHLSSDDGMALGLKVMAAFISGVRLHHFYVDSKIWRVSKSAALAKNLDLAK